MAAVLLQSQHHQPTGLATVVESPLFGLVEDRADSSRFHSKKVRTALPTPSRPGVLGTFLQQQQLSAPAGLKSGVPLRKKRPAAQFDIIPKGEHDENIVPLGHVHKKQSSRIQTFFSDDNMATAEEPFILGAPVSHRAHLQEMNSDFLSLHELDEARKATEIANNPPPVVAPRHHHSSSDVAQRFNNYIASAPQYPSTPVISKAAVTISPPSKRKQRVKLYASRVPISLAAPTGPDGLPSIRDKTPKLVRTTRVINVDSQLAIPCAKSLYVPTKVSSLYI